MPLQLSVVICTHNPRLDYLERVLNSLKNQTISLNGWELLFIDNASDENLCRKVDLTWHPAARFIREEQLGLTPARLRGIRESRADILVFVDDDNVLSFDYLESAFAIGRNFPLIGAWGGLIVPEFEETAPEWSKPYWEMLAVREFDQDRWSNFPYHDGAAPCGAGLCVRRIVAEKYSELATANPVRLGMGRKGKNLTSAEDSDIVFSACDVGLGKGLFTSLKLTHLIPAHRLKEEYLLKLREELSFSETILNAFRGHLPDKPSLFWKLVENYRCLRLDKRRRRFYDANKRGIARAIREIEAW